jgi:GxxExxY protein
VLANPAMVELCDEVRETAFALHRHLRHGHVEKIYENGLAKRLRKKGRQVRQQHPLRVFDEDGSVLGDLCADLFIDDALIVEVKACSTLVDEHTAQLLGYLRASAIRDGLLVNFGAPKLQIRKLVW